MKSFPWDSVAVSIGEDGYPVYDRAYMASDLREVYQTFFSNGIFTDSDTALKVSPGENMTVKVEPGRCCINGTVGYENEERELAIQASGSSDRIDTVVLRWDTNVDAREIDLYVLTGAPSATPVRPTLTRSETVWELGIADIYVTARSLSVKAEKVTDTRLESNRCGVVSPFVQLNTQNFYDQLMAQTQVAVELAQSALDGTIAGNLQGQIDGLGDPVLIGKGGTGADSVIGAANNLGFASLARANIIPSGADLNNYKTPGTYAVERWNDAANIANGPAGGAAFWMFVSEVYARTANTGSVMQIAISITNGRLYSRFFNSDTKAWSAWNTERFTSDVVGVANGGTGQTTIAAARNAMGLGNTAGALPVANGGTGATTAASARANIGISESSGTYWRRVVIGGTAILAVYNSGVSMNTESTLTFPVAFSGNPVVAAASNGFNNTAVMMTISQPNATNLRYFLQYNGTVTSAKHNSYFIVIGPA